MPSWEIPAYVMLILPQLNDWNKQTVVDALSTSWQEAGDVSDGGYIGLKEMPLGSYGGSHEPVT